MKEIYFVVEGRVQPKQRPRVVRRKVKVGNEYITKTMTFTPQATKDYEEQVKGAYLDACDGKPKKFEGAVEMVVNVYVQIPKSAPKKKIDDMITGNIRPIVKNGDVDNLFKAISDALNGLAYEDDSQIVSAKIRKFYAREACAEVTIKELVK